MTSASWTRDFRAPASAIWETLGDTARYNEAAGLPRQRIEEKPRDDGATDYHAHARMGPFRLHWLDIPCNWVAGKWFRHERRFLTGPLKIMTASFDIEATGNGCRGHYHVEAEPRGLVGRALLATGFFPATGKMFNRLASEAEQYALRQRTTPFSYTPPPMEPAARQRLDDAVTRLRDGPFAHGLAERLGTHVAESQEIDLWSIRPVALARKWDVPARHAIELCLDAVRVGLLRMRWDLLCPRCQVGKASSPSMDRLPAGAHCPSCNIDYTRDFTNNIELVFYPDAAIREVTSEEYCLFGPGGTPHIAAQLTVPPNASREEEAPLPAGAYRVRTLEPGGEDTLDLEAGDGIAVELSDDGVSASILPGAGRLVIYNHFPVERVFVLEEQAWRRDILTADRVITYQAFRDLFSGEILRPGDHIDIGNIVIMFTDLKGSTALYDRIGDPSAFALVREHFALLGSAVRDHDGCIVKTIGDAIMAAFTEPAAALRCAMDIHDSFAAYNAEHPEMDPMVLKIGLHSGRCISVTLNDQLDYYGSAANMAARLQGKSEGWDIVLSEEISADVAVQEILRNLDPVTEEAEMKGFSKPVPFVRIRPETLDRRRGGVSSS
jgi:class 3 adenylate cyclase